MRFFSSVDCKSNFRLCSFGDPLVPGSVLKLKKLRVKLEASLPDQTSVDSHLSLVMPLGQVKMVYLGIHPSRIYFAGN